MPRNINKHKTRLIFVAFLTITFLSSIAWAKEYYASPEGGGNGQSESSPYKIINFWNEAQPGDTLYLLDGVYTGSASMINPPSSVDGLPGQPITITALNDGQVFIDGESSRTPVKLSQNDWIILEGFNMGNAGPSNHGRVLWMYQCNHNIVRRVIGWDGDPYWNSYIFHTSEGSYNLFEDCAGWGPARKIFSNYHEHHTTFRRNFFRWTYAACGENVGTTGKCYSIGMTWAYGSQNITVENNIGTLDTTGFPSPPETTFISGIFGVDSTTENGGDKILGNIGYMLTNQKGSSYGSGNPYKAYHFSDRDPNTNYLMRDCIAYSEHDHFGNFQMTGMKFTGSNLTSIGSGGKNSGDAALHVEVSKVTDSIVQDATYYGVLDGYHVTNVMVNNNRAGNFKLNPPSSYSTEDPNLIGKSGNILQYGLTEDQRPKVAGRAVGAQIQKRYVNGNLTSNELWPWPMNERIKSAMLQSGYYKKGGLDGNGGIDLTQTIFEIDGGKMPTSWGRATLLSPPRNLKILQ